MSMRIINPIIAGSRPVLFDSDAADYIANVRIADGQSIEPAISRAITSFVLGCKSDGIWDSIKASCILAGARTLAGALVPLRGSAPSNVNFVDGDYSRIEGLKGNGSNKYLNSNRNNNADPQNSQHCCVFLNSITSAGTYLVGAGFASNGTTNFGRFSANPGNLFTRSRSSGVNSISGAGAATGFIGQSREDSSGYVFRAQGSTQSVSRASQTPSNALLHIFADSGTSSSRSDARIAFYSIGEDLNLEQLDNRVATLINDIGDALA